MSALPAAALALAALLAATPPAVPPHAPAPRAGARYVDRIRPGFVETVVADSLDGPVSMAIAPDGRVFVCEQDGRLRVVARGALLPRPFVVVPTVAQVEEGLLGVVCDPDFARNGWLYLCYTAQRPRRHDVVVRFTASGDTALAGSERPVFAMDDNDAHLHLGGAMRFGRDGKLYVGTGDNDNEGLSQSLGSTFGKLLRIERDGRIPADNPFVRTTRGHHQAIWARGFRNVFSFDVHPRTGRILVDDVGGSMFEEIDDAIAGANYGWPMIEGPGRHPGLRAPLTAYDHSAGCAITGGAFYCPDAPTFPREWLGRFLFEDFCWNELRWIDPAAPVRFHVFGKTLVAGPVDLRVGPDGDLYYLARGDSNPVGGAHTAGLLVRVSGARGARAERR